jgi:hypothetical protein
VSDGLNELRTAVRHMAESEAGLQKAEAILRDLLSHGEPGDAAFTLLRELRATLAQVRIHRHVLMNERGLLALIDGVVPADIAQGGIPSEGLRAHGDTA